MRKNMPTPVKPTQTLIHFIKIRGNEILYLERNAKKIYESWCHERNA
jgi:hypothetical protein